MGVQISKRYSSYKSQPNDFKLALNFPPNGPPKNAFGIFEILSFDFFSKISNSPLQPMEKSKTSIIWKKRDRKAKRREMWDSWVLF